MKPRGRPSLYNDQIVEEICEEIARGAALHRLCEDRKDFPAESAVYRWLEKHDDFREKYARARERQAERRAEEIILIADTEKDAAVARNRIDARKWAAAKLLPKKYGEKYTTEITGPGGGPVELVARRAIPDDIDEARLKSIEAALRLAITPPREEIDNDEEK